MGYGIRDAAREWDDGLVTAVHAIQNPSKAQHYIRTVGIFLGILYLALGPLLFLPVCRGSLVNSFLGVRYGVAIKWHRCSLRFHCSLSALLLKSFCMSRGCFHASKASLGF
jgi:hypothetical protein